MKSNRTLLMEVAQTIRAQQDGAMERRLSRSLSHLVGVITERYTDMLKYAPSDAQYFQLSITVNAIGEPQTSESSTSTTQPGDWSPQSPSVEDSSKSPSETDLPFVGMVPREMWPKSPESSSPTPPPNNLGVPEAIESWRHMFEGFIDGNCNHCNMPVTAFQHPRMYTHAGIVFSAGNIRLVEERPKTHEP